MTNNLQTINKKERTVSTMNTSITEIIPTNANFEEIKVDYEGKIPTVSGRELHERLEVETPYHKWFPRMCEYGFEEKKDYVVTDIFVPNSNGGKQTQKDHRITIPMAKELCMLQRNAKGKEFRQYFISIEEKWNSPEMVMKRALEFANRQVQVLLQQNTSLNQTVAVQSQQITELKPKASYYDVILNSKDLMSVTQIAKDYGKSAIWLNDFLHNEKVQFKQGDIWLLYQNYAEQGYTSTKTHTYLGNNGENHSKVHTYWTQKGRLFLYNLLKSKGFIPTIEQA